MSAPGPKGDSDPILEAALRIERAITEMRLGLGQLKCYRCGRQAHTQVNTKDGLRPWCGCWEGNELANTN